MRRIRTKLIAGFTMVIALMVSLSLYIAGVSQRSLSRSVGKNSIFVAEEMLTKINYGIYQKIEDLQSHSTELFVKESLSESNREFEKLDDIQEYIDREDKKWTSAPWDQITPFMQNLIDNKSSTRLRQRIVQFHERKYGYRVFKEVFVTNRFGANIAQTIKTADYRQDDEKWWQTAKNKGLYISDVEHDQSSGTYGITVGIRIDDEEGNFLGALKAVLSVKEVIREAEIHLKRYQTTSTILITKDGSLIYRTEAFKFMEKLPNKNLLKMIQNERGFFTAEDGGMKKLFSYTRSKGYREFGGLGWILIVGHDLEEVLKPAFVLRNTIMAASLTIIIISIIVALLISRSITKPIAKLSKGAEIIGKGDLKHTVELESKDEIGELAAAFNQMTERRRVAEEALRESEERLSLALDAINDGLWDFNPQTGEAHCNPRWYTMLGYDPGELPSTYSTWADLLHPDDRSYAETRIKDFLKNREDTYSIEFRMRAKNGDWRWIYSRGKAFEQDSEGNVTRMIGTHTDITERKLAEEKQQTILEAALDAFCFVSLKGRLLEVSDSCCDILGYSREELLRMFIQDIEDTENYNEIVRQVKKLVKQGSARFETRLKCKDGNMIDVEVSVNDFDADEGQIFVLLRDITERKHLEKQIVNAQIMEAMGTLAGGIAHDFNNILMGIMGNTSLMLSDISTSHPYHARLESIEQSVKSGAELTKKLLGFTRRGKYEVKPIDLNELIRSENRIFGRTKKEITIHGAYERNLWTVEADQDQIKQVLLSLYVNAWQAMPGGGDIYTQTENLYLDEEYAIPLGIDPGRYVKVSVIDTGVGMDQSTQQRVFEPFFTTKEMGRGIGLGLASAYGIVKNHGGAINVYSEKGKGATFSIYLPASEKKAVREKEAAGEVLKGEETILLVDDEEMIIDVGEKILKKLGYNVMTARGGKEAIELYKKNRDKIDMVVLDMIMPFMDGGDTYDRLKQINANIKTLLSSGYSVNGQAREILERGCNGFIQKPFNIWELSQAIRRILDR